MSLSAKSSWASGPIGAGRDDGQARSRSRSATSAGSAVCSQSRSAATVSVSSGPTCSGSATSMPNGSVARSRWSCTASAEQFLDERVPGQRPDADGQVQRPLALRLGRVQPAAGQVEGVAGRQDHVERGRAVRGGGHLVLAAAPGLPFQRLGQHRLVDAPAFGAVDLQHEHVMGVVVGGEALVAGRRQVRVDLQRLAQFGAEPAGEVDQRRPDPVQALQDERGAVRVQLQDLVVDHLVADLGAGAAGAGEAPGRAAPCPAWPPAGTACAGRGG